MLRKHLYMLALTCGGSFSVSFVVKPNELENMIIVVYTKYNHGI
jgi:hypothetical protein